MIFDTFMANNELDMLECRLYELERVPNLVHICVEADVDHQDHPKPYWISENIDRFDQWKDRLIVVRASGLPTFAENPDAWSRENAQREWAGKGLIDAGAEDDDIVLHGDLDEIPRPVAVRNVNPRGGYVGFEMACYSMAVDWQHPENWRGTVACQARYVSVFSKMRDARNVVPALPNAGWHLGWLGGREAQLTKLGSFCHPEIRDRTLEGIEANLFLSEGYHVDGRKLTPVEVDVTFPRWIRDGKAPASWFRPRDHAPSGWRAPAGY